jgi:outer membrane protein assembly factor BamB
MTDRFQIVKCPSCGAPLDLKPGHERNFKCEFCGTTLQDQTSQEDEQTGVFPKLIIQTTTYSPPPMITYSGGDTSAGKAGRAVGCLVTIIVLATVIPIVIGVLGAAGVTLGSIFAVFQGQQAIEDLLPTGPGSILSTEPDIYSFGASVTLPSDNDTQADFVGVASLADDTHRLMYFDLEAEKAQRWQSEPLGDEASYVYNFFAANQSFVYFSVKTKLYAFNRANGTTAWQTTLPDEVTNICEDCLRVTGQRVVALTADGTLQAYDAQTGQPVWSVKLEEQPRQLLLLGSNPAVKDDRDDHVSLFVYNALDGSLLHTIQPQCVNNIFEDDPQEPYLYDPMWAVPDGQSILFGFGTYEPYCIQKWDGVTGTMTWEALLATDEGASSLRPEEGVLVTETGLYLPAYQELWFVNLADGTYQRLVQNEDYDLTPLGVVQDTLITLAYRRVGTARNELWALNADGTVRWTFVPTSDDMMDNLLSEVAYEEGIWTPLMGEDAVYLLTAYSEPKRVGFERINLQDGTSGGEKILEVASDFDVGSMWFSILGWDQQHVWVVMTDIVALYNFQTGELVNRWP